MDKLRLERNRSSTRKIYYSVWKQFNEFFIRLDFKPQTWEDRLILFVGFLVERNRKSSTIRSYISAVKAVLREDNVEIQEDKYLLSSLTKACKYKNDQVRIRLPIQKGVLKILLDKISEEMGSTQPYLCCMYKAIFSSAYFGLLRIGEIAHGEHPVTVGGVNVARNKRKMQFTLWTSKTHWLDVKPQIVTISSTSNYPSTPYCPYRILRDYMVIRPQGLSLSDQFFVLSDRTPVTTDLVRRKLKEILGLLGLEEDMYNFHSLRIGRTLDLYHKLHLPIQSIKKIGHWRSNCVYTYLS